jgi:hypothetical protein
MKNPSLFLSAILLYVVTCHAYAETIILENGDSLTGQVISRSSDSLVLSHQVLGEVTIAISAIKTSTKSHGRVEAQAVAKTPATSKAKSESEIADSGLFNTDWLTDWKYELQAGVTGSSGKSDDQKITIGFTADYEDHFKRWKHKTSYYRYESEGDLSDHSLVSSLNRDFLMPGETRFYFAGGQFDYDEFKDFDYRLAVNGGIGYELYKSSKWRLLGRAGLGLNRTFAGTREETVTEGLLQLDSKWKINSHQFLDFSNIFHPNISDSGEYRNITTLDWKLKLDKNYGMGVVVGFANEYDSLNEESDKNDFKYHLSLSLTH